MLTGSPGTRSDSRMPAFKRRRALLGCYSANVSSGAQCPGGLALFLAADGFPFWPVGQLAQTASGSLPWPSHTFSIFLVFSWAARMPGTPAQGGKAGHLPGCPAGRTGSLHWAREPPRESVLGLHLGLPGPHLPLPNGAWVWTSCRDHRTQRVSRPLGIAVSGARVTLERGLWGDRESLNIRDRTRKFTLQMAFAEHPTLPPPL